MKPSLRHKKRAFRLQVDDYYRRLNTPEGQAKAAARINTWTATPGEGTLITVLQITGYGGIKADVDAAPGLI